MKKAHFIPKLKQGDTIAIVAPAKQIDATFIDFAKDFFTQRGFQVVIGKHAKKEYFYFSGTDEERIADFQWAIDNPEVKAIVCARGGYGSVRVLEKLDWKNFNMNPKWIVGFSDITVFHQHLQKNSYPSIHATMPLNFKTNSNEALTSLIDSFSESKTLNYNINSHKYNILGGAEGVLLGGNLSIVYSLLGTDSQPDYENSILFLEDLSEQLYHIERMFFALKKAGVFSKINAIIIGGFTELKDLEKGFDKSFEEIVLSVCKPYDIPIVFDFPAGHIEDNRALIFGEKVKLQVNKEGVLLKF